MPGRYTCTDLARKPSGSGTCTRTLAAKQEIVTRKQRSVGDFDQIEEPYVRLVEGKDGDLPY